MPEADDPTADDPTSNAPTPNAPTPNAPGFETHTITSQEEALQAYRSKDLRQALYDAGEVVMGDVLVNLHGDDHRARRRLENRLFRKDTHTYYEKTLFPAIIDATLAPYVADDHAELVSLSHQMMMNLAALTAGVDRPQGTPEETFHLYSYLMTFIEGATLAHYTGDKEAKRAEVVDALARFDTEFLMPSIHRRRLAVAAVDAGEIDESDLPRDVLTVLIRNQDNLELPSDVVLRETAFFLLAGAHTSATAYVRTAHNIFLWLSDHPEDEELIHADTRFVQRCMHETIRLQPSSPVGMRWALNDVILPSGRAFPSGSKVVIDLLSVNRDTEVWGSDAAEFNPRRPIPNGLMPWGLSFGSGMHACIGQDLAGGVLCENQAPDTTEHLYGLVPVAVQALFDRGARPDPEDPPFIDPSNVRQYWGTYSVRFGGS